MKFSQRLLIILTLSLAPLARGQTLEVLHSFNGLDGINPRCKLVQNNGGDFYGTTELGGGEGDELGTIFKVTFSGALTTLVTFNGLNGDNPSTGLTLSSDGNFYGTTSSTVFKLATNDELITLASLDSPNGLVQGSDGNLYGTTSSGGANHKGTVFRIVMPVSVNSRVSGNEMILSWPTNQVGFTLQSASTLNSPTNWIDSTNAPAIVGAHFIVTNNISGSSQFYRLQKP